MTEENEVVTTATQQIAEASQQEPARDYEAEARASGWVPEAEWKGDKKPAKFLSAEEYVQRGEELTPFLKKENRRLTERLDRVTRDFETRLSRLDKVNQFNFQRQQEDYERELGRLRTAQEQAVEAGDKAEFRRLENEKIKLKPPTDIPVEQADDVQVQIDNMTRAFKETNPWYGVDDDMTAIAERFSVKIQAASDNKMANAENLRQTEAYMRKNYPHLYGQTKPAANGHAAVDTGGAFNGFNAKADPLAKLPAEARAQAKNDMAKFPKRYPSADAWLKVYNS